jgi:hypothetical protein
VKKKSAAGADVTHALSCLKVRKTEVNMRHNVIRNEITDTANKLGCTALVEPQDLSSQKRADTHIITPTGDVLWVDTSIVHPAAPTWIKRGSAERKLAAADKRATEKHVRYDPSAAEQEAGFIAAVAETYGGFNGEFVALAKRITRFAEREGCPWTVKEAYTELISSIAVGIQRGNARVIQRMRMLNKAAGLAVHDPTRAPRPPSSTHPQPAARPRAPAQPDGFGVVDASSLPLPEQPPAPRAAENKDISFGFGEPDDMRAFDEHEAEELGFATAASASAEMLELDECMLDESADNDDDQWPAFPADKSAVQISVWQRPKPNVIVIDP